MVTRCKGIVHSIDFADDQPEGENESGSGSQIDQSHLGRGKAIEIAIDCLEVGIETVRGAEDGGLVDCHYEHNRLGEEDSDRPFHGQRQFLAKGALIFICNSVSIAGLLLQVLAPGFEYDGGVGFLEENEAEDGVAGADNAKDPKYPSPAKVFDK